jgi:hypothetical protein
MQEDVRSLVRTLASLAREDVVYERCGDTHLCGCDRFDLSFVVASESFEIRNIESRQQGLGARIIGAIHEFCDEHGLEVSASNVLDTAISFWRKMGYEEGSTAGEYFRIG